MKVESLRIRLLVWLLAPLAGILAVNIFNIYDGATNTANVVTDRTLLASARNIAEEISVADGVIDAQIPPAAIEIFDTGYGDLVFFRVQTRDGHLLNGYPDLPLPAEAGGGTQPVYYEHRYREHSLRLVALNHPIIGADEASPVTVVVGSTLRNHGELIHTLLRGAIGQQVLLLVVSALLVLTGVSHELMPLLRLRDTVLDDQRDPLEPLPVGTVQTELRPLVDALNQHKRRVQQQMAAQTRFIANAAHQMKTPLTVLATQAAFAQRARLARDREEALAALQKSVQQSAHMVNQLLTLSRAEPGARRVRHQPVDLAVLARDVLEDFARRVVTHKLDLMFEQGRVPAVVIGDETMLREMMVNLVDNAVRYTPAGGSVMVTVGGDAQDALLTIADTGPGIPPDERPHVFERFYRVIGNGGEGSGLGLAIVWEVVAAAGGTVSLDAPAAGSGLVVTVRLPAADAGDA